jgi:hypothetical protein
MSDTEQMTRASFLKMIQKRIATVAIGASTLRNQGASNVVSNTREFLKRLDLGHFSAKTAINFRNALDKETEKLRNALPIGARNWGAARKALNIFLRDAFYNHYLHEEFGFRKLEPWLELPLDKDAARGLLEDSKDMGIRLPRWPGVKHLKSRTSKRYQDAAERVGQRRGIARAHLDLIYFRQQIPERPKEVT